MEYKMCIYPFVSMNYFHTNMNKLSKLTIYNLYQNQLLSFGFTQNPFLKEIIFHGV